MKKTLKRILSILFLGPLLPILVVDGDANAPVDGSNNNNNNNADGDLKNELDGKNNLDDTNNDDDLKNSNSSKANSKTFTQDDIDAIVSSRLTRERTKITNTLKKEFEENKKREQMTEFEKLKSDFEAEKKKNEELLTKSNEKLIEAQIISQSTIKNIIDSDVAYKLINMNDVYIDDNGKVNGVNEALDKLIEKMPYLVNNKQNNSNIGDDQNNNAGQSNRNHSMNELIRKYRS